MWAVPNPNPRPLRYGEPDWDNRAELEIRPREVKSYEEYRLEALTAEGKLNPAKQPNMGNQFSNQQMNASSFRDKTKFLTVIVGTQPSAKWVLHEHLLMSKSQFFNAMMSHGFKERQTGIITLPEEHPDVFDCWASFLYSGCITDFTHKMLLQCYMLATRMKDDKFEQACHKAIKSSWTSYAAQDIKYVLDETIETDPFRQLCVEHVASGILSGRYTFDNADDKQLLAEYMPELMEGVVKAVAARSSFGFKQQLPKPSSDPLAEGLFGDHHVPLAHFPPPPPPPAPLFGFNAVQGATAAGTQNTMQQAGGPNLWSSAPLISVAPLSNTPNAAPGSGFRGRSSPTDIVTPNASSTSVRPTTNSISGNVASGTSSAMLPPGIQSHRGLFGNDSSAALSNHTIPRPTGGLFGASVISTPNTAGAPAARGLFGTSLFSTANAASPPPAGGLFHTSSTGQPEAARQAQLSGLTNTSAFGTSNATSTPPQGFPFSTSSLSRPNPPQSTSTGRVFGASSSGQSMATSQPQASGLTNTSAFGTSNRKSPPPAGHRFSSVPSSSRPKVPQPTPFGGSFGASSPGQARAADQPQPGGLTNTPAFGTSNTTNPSPSGGLYNFGLPDCEDEDEDENDKKDKNAT